MLRIMTIILISLSFGINEPFVSSRWMGPVEWQPHIAMPLDPPRGDYNVMSVNYLTSMERRRVAIVVESGIYDEISDSLLTYTNDLTTEGFSSIIISMSGNAQYLRNMLINLYEEPESL